MLFKGITCVKSTRDYDWILSIDYQDLMIFCACICLLNFVLSLISVKKTFKNLLFYFFCFKFEKVIRS